MVKRKVKSTGVKVGDIGGSSLPYNYKCNICGKEIPHWSRGTHLTDSTHNLAIFKFAYKVVN